MSFDSADPRADSMSPTEQAICRQARRQTMTGLVREEKEVSLACRLWALLFYLSFMNEGVGKMAALYRADAPFTGSLAGEAL